MANLHVLLIYGGQSSEHDVSLKSAANVFNSLDKEKYTVTCCLIDRKGKWWLQNSVNEKNDGDSQLLPVPGEARFQSVTGDQSIRPDVVFPVLHGKNGEDGTIQGFIHSLGIPCVGPTTLGAALTMDKDVTKRILREADIPTVDGAVWYTDLEKPTYTSLSAELGGVLFVKPSRSGSSLGVSRVTDEDSFDAALGIAAEHDSMVLIERAVKGNEYQIAVLGNNEPRLTDICEIVIGAEFHDFKDKYSADSSAQFHIPARLSPEQTKKMKKYAHDAYMGTRCRGLARIDFFVSDTGDMYLNEINAIPGFTGVSVYPKLWEHAGLSGTELVSQLIDLALE